MSMELNEEPSVVLTLHFKDMQTFVGLTCVSCNTGGDLVMRARMFFNPSASVQFLVWIGFGVAALAKTCLHCILH